MSTNCITSMFMYKKSEDPVAIAMVKDMKVFDVTVEVRKSYYDPEKLFVKVEYYTTDKDPKWMAKTIDNGYDGVRFKLETNVGPVILDVSQGDENYFVHVTW